MTSLSRVWHLCRELPEDLVTIISSYGRREEKYFCLMSWQPDVFHLCFFPTPQHFATLSSASALPAYGQDRFAPRYLDEICADGVRTKAVPAMLRRMLPDTM